MWTQIYIMSALFHLALELLLITDSSRSRGRFHNKFPFLGAAGLRVLTSAV